MTVPSTARRAGPLLGDGVTTSFPFTFKVFQASDIQFTVSDASGNETVKVLNSDFSVSINADQTTSPGGSVTYPISGSPLPVGASAVITGALPYDQTASLPAGGNFRAPVVEQAMDRLAIQVQQIAEQVARALVFSVTDATGSTLPPAAARALRTLGFDSLGRVSVNTPADGSAASLALLLASNANASEGGGMVSGDITLNYAADTLMWFVQRGGVTPRMFGAVGDGVADDAAALAAWAASALPLRGDRGARYYTTADLALPVNTDIDGCGSEIICGPGVQVSYTGSVSALPDFSADVTRDQQALTFASAHGLSHGDKFFIHDPTDGSWSTIRNEYRAGEIVTVGEVTSSTALTAENPLHAAYVAATVNLWKMAKAEVSLRNITIRGDTTTTSPALKLTYCTHFRLDNVRLPSAGYIGLYVDRCAGGDVFGPVAGVPTTTVTDAYCALVAHSQDVSFWGVHFFGRRAGFDIGGDDVVNGIPSRNITLHGGTVKNRFASNFPAVDLHGNVDGFRCLGTTIYGGASWGGMNVEYINCDIRDGVGSGALIVGGSEWLGGKAVVRGGSMRASALASTSSLVRIVINATAKDDTHLLITDHPMVEAGPNTIMTLVEFEALATKKCNPVIDGVTYISAASLTQHLRVQGTGAGGTGDFICVDHLAGAIPSGTFMYIAVSGFVTPTKKTFMEQSATVAVVPVSAAAFASTSFTWPISYGSVVPRLALAQDGRTVNSKAVNCAFRSNAAAGATIDIFTCDAANFGATTPTINVHVTAAMTE